MADQIATVKTEEERRSEPIGGAGRPARVARIAFLAGVMLLLYGPLAVLALFSFNDQIVIALPFHAFTLEWYREALDNKLVRESLKNSLILASIVTPVAVVLGTLAAFALTRFAYRLRGGVAILVGGPLVVPWLLIAVGLLLFFSRLKIALGFTTIGLSHVVVAFPLVAAIVSARLLRFDPRQEEAARDLGATNGEVLRFVILPHLAPAIAAAAVLAFSYSFNNFVISFFTGGFELTFPTWVFSTLRHAQNVPIVNAISTLVSAVQLAVIVLAWVLWNRRARRIASADPMAMLW